MAKIRIGVGDMVEISQLQETENEGAKPYLSVVESFDKKRKVLVLTPISSGMYVRLPLGETYSVKFISKKGIFRINATISNYLSEGDVHFTELKLTGKGERVQQRNFFRLTYLNAVRFQVMQEDEAELPFSEEKYSGIVRDLSGSGMKLVTTIDIERHKIIQFNLKIEDYDFEMVGEIVFKNYNEYAVQPYTYGVMFLGLSEAIREKIVMHLHQMELKSL